MNVHRTYCLAVALIVAAGTLVLTVPQASAQETAVRETEARLQQLRQQIAEDELRLQSTEQEEQASARQLADLNRQIAMREELVDVYAKRISEMRAEEDSLAAQVARHEADLAGLKEDYTARATHAYKYGRQHDVALILAAESINQMLIRIGYLRRFSNERRGRLNALYDANQQLHEAREALAARLVDMQILLTQADREQERLANLQTDRETEVRRLRSLRVDLSEELENKRTMARELSDRIAALIASARPAPAEPGAVGRAFPRAGALDAATLSALATSFRAARGRMPWPAVGSVQEPFGEVTNPVYGTRTPNPGILIATSPSAEIRAVAAGRVSTVDVMPDIGSYIIVEHGDYHTVYGNFSLIYTQAGAMIEPGDVIGRGGTTNEPRGNAVFFSIFENAVPVDPSAWLARR
jgi:septal ring factor EnvC (AmiA/AmiB activator)